MLEYFICIIASVLLFGIFLAGLVHGRRVGGAALDIALEHWTVAFAIAAVFGVGYLMGRWGWVF